MKWLLVVTALGPSNQGPAIVPDAFIMEALYGSLNECKAAVDDQLSKSMAASAPRDSGIAYCFAVDPDKTVGRPVGAVATPGRTGWLPYSVIYAFKFKDQP
jgi:hypothetical protein